MKKLSYLILSFLMCTVTATYAADKAPMGADRHTARGITCANCHGDNMADPKYPDRNTCFQCHVESALIEKTKDLKPTNPHSAPHNNECTLCHMQHEKTANYCETCHKFYKFNVP